MRTILPDQLWIGNAADTHNVSALYDAGVMAVVDLAREESISPLPREFLYFRIPLVDGSGNSHTSLTLALEITRSLLQKQIPFMVACGAGMSRSPAIAATALALHRGETPEEVLKEITTDKPHDVAPMFWSAVHDVWEGMQS